ncbi:imelysin family protein [Roseibium algae]|uniref:Imelysin family protein n=1 Tax=Roseibium algae TaxID=3123038 RepID=A0ABU8TL54_9HYPH
MHKTIVASVTLAAAVFCTAPAWAIDDDTPHVQQSIDGYIRPAFAKFAEEAALLAPATNAVCQDTTQESKAEFSDRYRALVEAFGGVSFLRFGPLIDDHRLESLAFMPDPRGITQRQIRKMLAEQDASATNPAQLAEKSVALQGLTALQLIAFDKSGNVILGDPSDKRDYICGYAEAITLNVSRITSKISVEWQDPDGYSSRLLSPSPETGQIRSSKEAIETIFNALVTGLIVVKDQELLPAIGTEISKSKANRLPFTRSADGRAYLISELEGIHATLVAANFSPSLGKEFGWLLNSLDFEFNNGITSLKAINQPLRQSIKDDEIYNRLNLLVITVNSLRDTMALELAGALSLTGGFNALDGD